MTLLDKLKGFLLDLQTPSCIISEIGLSRGISLDEKRIAKDESYRARVVATITKVKSFIVSDPLTEDDYSTVALFLNPDVEVEWNEETLLDAYNWTMKVDLDPALAIDCECDYPTSDNTRRVSLIYIYRLLLSKGCVFGSKSTRDEILRARSLLLMSSDYLLSLIQSKIPCVDKGTLINFALSVECLKDKRAKDLTLCSKIYEEWKPEDGYYPRTKEEAIVAAYKYYGKDISSLEDSLLEYNTLKSKQFPGNDYSRKLVKVVPDAYNLSVFNPYLPLSCYTPQLLKKFCEKDCLRKSSSSATNYEQLQMSYTVERFHVGIVPGCSLESSLYLTDLEDEDINLFVTYGSYLTGWKLYTIQELETMFLEHRYFYSDSNGSFSLDAIQSLENITLNMSKRTMLLKKKSRKRWLSLNKIIKSLREVGNEVETVCSMLLQLENKERAIQTLTKLLHIGLFSRGLRNLKDKWPIWDVPPSNIEENERIVLEMLIRFDEYLTEEDDNILDFPLLMIEQKTHIIRVNHDYTRGLTIRNRLDMVKKGQEGPIASCIMTTSGYIIATSYTYLTALGISFEEDFSKIKIVL